MSVTQDWRFKNECFPFEDENNYYITVESEYETPVIVTGKHICWMQKLNM